MSALFRKINSFAKDLLLASRIGLLLRPLAGVLRFAANFSYLASWIQKYGRNLPFNDFYKPLRAYPDRVKLHTFVAEREALATRRIHYFEFGVAGATSFRWWLAQNGNPDSRFHGFDTFEGLPETWGTYSKGE